jgi:hypothetical protein
LIAKGIWSSDFETSSHGVVASKTASTDELFCLIVCEQEFEITKHIAIDVVAKKTLNFFINAIFTNLNHGRRQA